MNQKHKYHKTIVVLIIFATFFLFFFSVWSIENYRRANYYETVWYQASKRAEEYQKQCISLRSMNEKLCEKIKERDEK